MNSKGKRLISLVLALILGLGIFAAFSQPVSGSTPLSKAAAAADSIAKIGYSQKGPKKTGCLHDKNAYKISTTKAKLKDSQKISCSVYASLVLQEAGCLPKGTICKHTSKDHKKDTLADCISNSSKLKNCTTKRVNCLFSKLDSKYKKKGAVYIYPSNMAVYAGDSHIWSFNSGGGKDDYWYTKKSQVYKKGGYCFETKIIYVILPNNK